VRLLDHLKIDKAHIVGYSMGGFITGNLVARHPDRVASAVIGAAGWHEHPEARFALLEEIGASLEAGTGIAPLMIALTPPGQAPPTPAMLKASNQMIMLMNDPLALAAAIRGMRGLNIERQRLVENKVPALAIIGSIDPLKDGVDELAAVMSHLELVVIDGADHMTAINHPLLLQSIRDHLKKNALQPAAPVGQD
jgi:pimeloyl-ACP methyl ester carboxylesterase